MAPPSLTSPHPPLPEILTRFPTLLLLLLLSLSIPTFSQSTLTYQNNAPVYGDSNDFRGIQWLEPGAGGAGLSWDFSGIQYSGNDMDNFIPYVPQQSLNGVVAYNMLMEDNGFEYYLQSNPDTLLELACIKGNMTFINTNPLVKMKFPFAYGDSFSDDFNGNAAFTDKPEYPISGYVSVLADAYGTLILPGLSLQNVLRVKQEKYFTEFRSCNSLHSRAESYKWYAPGYRYPVLSINYLNYQVDNKPSVTTKTAYLNLNQTSQGSVVAAPPALSKALDKSKDLPPLSLFPNPFQDQLQYAYFLKETTTVSLQLTDMYGKSAQLLFDNQIQSKGLHSADLDLSQYNLSPGVYLLKFSFGDQVLSRKVVKI